MQIPALIYSQSEVDLEVLVLARKEKKKKKHTVIACRPTNYMHKMSKG